MFDKEAIDRGGIKPSTSEEPSGIGMTDEPSLTPVTKLYWLGLLEKDRGEWVLRDGEGDEAIFSGEIYTK